MTATDRYTHVKPVVFALCCVGIALISVHDAMLVVVHHETISELERNPIGKWLLDIQQGEVWLFVLVKLAGTAVVCTVLVSLYQRCRKLALPIALSLTTFQSLLLVYLHCR